LKEDPASGAVFRLGSKSGLSQQSDLKQQRHQQGIPSALQYPQSVEQCLENQWAGITLGSNRCHEIDQACATRHQREIFSEIGKGFLYIGLGHTIKRVVGLFEEIEIRGDERFQGTSEPAFHTPCATRDTTHFPESEGIKRDNPITFHPLSALQRNSGCLQ
jgi:hypothetical protein